MGSWVGVWRPTGHPSPDMDGTGQCPPVHFACLPGTSPLSTWFTSAGHTETHVALYLNMGLVPAQPASSSWGWSPSGCICSVMATVGPSHSSCISNEEQGGASVPHPGLRRHMGRQLTRRRGPGTGLGVPVRPTRWFCIHSITLMIVINLVLRVFLWVT